MLVRILEVVSVFGSGLLAGEEFIVRYGVRGAIASLDERQHIQSRQALILGMRVLVPVLFFLTLTTGAAATYLTADLDLRSALRCAGLLALLTFISVTLAGTVPINQAALKWNPDAPPKDWRAMVRRWEQLDDVRTWMALAAFGSFLVSIGVR